MSEKKDIAKSNNLKKTDISRREKLSESHRKRENNQRANKRNLNTISWKQKLDEKERAIVLLIKQEDYQQPPVSVCQVFRSPIP